MNEQMNELKTKTKLIDGKWRSDFIPRQAIQNFDNKADYLRFKTRPSYGTFKLVSKIYINYWTRVPKLIKQWPVSRLLKNSMYSNLFLRPPIVLNRLTSSVSYQFTDDRTSRYLLVFTSSGFVMTVFNSAVFNSPSRWWCFQMKYKKKHPNDPMSCCFFFLFLSSWYSISDRVIFM